MSVVPARRAWVRGRARRRGALAWVRWGLLLGGLLLGGLLGAGGCMAVPTVDTTEPAPLAVGESREVVLEALRLDVAGYEQVLTRADLLALPRETRRKLWLYDLDLRGEAGEQRLIDHALAAIRATDPTDASLGQAERNMVRLLNMTPANADLSGTPMANLLNLAPQVGIAAPEVLAESMGIEVDAPFLGGEALAGSLVDNVISSHPNARRRPAPVSDAHPDGTAPVPKGHLPVTLEDVATGLETLSQTYGPYVAPGETHPGFVSGATKADMLEPGFFMAVRANANALPFKGCDLSHAAAGSVTSIGKESTPLFDFSDPNWITIVGVVEKPAVTEMQFTIVEAPGFVKAGDSALPLPMGNGPVWHLPAWSLERVVADAGLRAFQERTWSKSWALGADPKPLFEVTLREGWMQLRSKGDIGAPPPPLYIWDLMGLVAQTRLHDGPDPEAPSVDAIPEGQASVTFTLRDIPIGVTHDQINASIQANLEADPSSLVSVAAQILDQSAGAPDFYYVRPLWNAAEQGDWLLFVLPDDVAGAPTYATPGFFADSALTQPIHSQRSVEGDTSHLKVRVSPGQTFYCADQVGGAFRVDVLAKPSLARVRLRVTRVR